MTTISLPTLTTTTPTNENAKNNLFKQQMETLQARSAATMELGPPTWLTNPPCLEGPLTEEELTQWRRDGFFIKQNVFDPSELQPVMKDIEAQVETVAQKLLNAGLITDTCADLGFYERMAGLEKQFKGASVLLHKTPDLPSSFRELWSDKRLVDIAQQLLGGEKVDVAGHPVWNLRVKVPQADSSVVPWHQDAAYLDPESAHTLQVTAWIPLIDATADNGCMQMIKGAHKSGKTAKHSCCAGGTWYVEMDRDDASSRLGVDCHDHTHTHTHTCAMPLGAVLFLSNLIPHRSLPNKSKDIRWSLDLRWQDAKLPAGFWGIKDTILMRKSDDPTYKPDWASFVSVDRASAQSHAAAAAVVREEGKGEENLKEEKEKEAAAAAAADELKPVIAGPWMLRWELVHHNQHTAALEEEGEWHKA